MFFLATEGKGNQKVDFITFKSIVKDTIECLGTSGYNSVLFHHGMEKQLWASMQNLGYVITIT